jgi:serine/threonine-protein kinase
MTMTQTAAVIGTAQYLSPEQAKGEQVDARSDLYSTGCLLYELLTVRPPFVGDSPVAVAYQHVREEPQAPSVFDPEITPEMDAIVLKALVKDPNYRYQSADEMRADIEACLDGQPVAATAALGAVGYGGYPDDQPTTALRQEPGAAATTMLPPMSPDDSGYGYDERPDRRRQQKKNNTSTILLVVAGILVLVGAILIGKWAFSGDNNADKPFPAPNFIGNTYADAQKMAENSHLKLADPTYESCENQPKNKVCDQDPKPGTDVKKDQTISLVISKGAPKVAVPNVLNQTFDSAKTLLESNKYQFNVLKKEEVSTQPAGTVIKQSLDLGKEVQKGSTITLTVAKAEELVTIPDTIVGQSCNDAKAALQQLGLVPSCNPDNGDGKVTGSNPGVNTQVKKNTPVTLTVEAADDQNQQVQVPELQNHTVKDARKMLQDRGLQLNVTGAQDDNAIIFGNSNPPAGSTVNKGDTITVFAVLQGGNGNGNNGGTLFGGVGG